MKSSHVVTLRVPGDMKRRLERVAEGQGVSMNQLANYLLNRDITQMEAEMSLERRLTRTSVESLKRKAHAALDRVPARPVPEWDTAD